MRRQFLYFLLKVFDQKQYLSQLDLAIARSLEDSLSTLSVKLECTGVANGKKDIRGLQWGGQTSAKHLQAGLGGQAGMAFLAAIPY